ncbi:dipeptidyl peptidase 1-like [Anneissia japonica]|uniref:dipeptidyl peptidase 1-like n=1 Tax=Anneissia japonica TaxID=1529436 RepID=UPI0014255DC5|nr:dipeptidyl peptidase 1-like [Anneissia japonica]
MEVLYSLTFLHLQVFLFCLAVVNADTPADCKFDDIVGKWKFSVGKGGFDNTLNCTDPAEKVKDVSVELLFPDVAVDLDYGHKGHWTLIYNQGFEVALNNKKYFAFSKYITDKAGKTQSFCNETLPGWVHNIDGKDWACYVGKKEETIATPEKKTFYRNNLEFVKKINSAQSSWTAGLYPEHEKYTLEQMKNRAGGSTSKASRPLTAQVSQEVAKLAETLPSEFDWRNVAGQNFVTPVRNQAQCGSCYAFASMAMLEARLKIETNNTVSKVFSPQDVVDCSEYSQGCSGGFPYLIAGKYAQDFGVVEESCSSYTGKDGKCVPNKCQRYYSADYSYVGGFYGACNEALMRIALLKNGPLAVGFEVLDDFFNYKHGIYQHTGLQDKFNPFETTNHAVLVVGYGTDATTGLNYWSVKNSWGPTWGENGYFRIVRGADEVGIESMAVESFPIIP